MLLDPARLVQQRKVGGLLSAQRNQADQGSQFFADAKPGAQQSKVADSVTIGAAGQTIPEAFIAATSVTKGQWAASRDAFVSTLRSSSSAMKAVMTAILDVIQRMMHKLLGVEDLRKPEVQAEIVAEVVAITRPGPGAPEDLQNPPADVAVIVAELTQQVVARIVDLPKVSRTTKPRL